MPKASEKSSDSLLNRAEDFGKSRPKKKLIDYEKAPALPENHL
jgi:hypothetical protein